MLGIQRAYFIHNFNCEVAVLLSLHHIESIKADQIIQQLHEQLLSV